ncbi:hypothetical protein M569_00366, partial [Genlisea aurea]
KPGFLKNIVLRGLLSCMLVVAFRFAYLVAIRGESCDVANFCFLPDNFDVVAGVRQLTKLSSSAIVSSPSRPKKKPPDILAADDFHRAVRFYWSVFEELISDGILRPNHKSLCVDSLDGADVYALREVGVEDSIGVSRKPFKPLVVSGEGFKQPFPHQAFDFTFCGNGAVEKSAKQAEFAAEIDRTLKPQGFLVVHTGANDSYSFESLLGLFNFTRLVKSKDITDGFNSRMREIVLQKLVTDNSKKKKKKKMNKCSSTVASYKQDLIKRAEPLISKEPQKPWITLKKNLQKIKYLPSLVDISFKPRYVYIDVGARSYGSSIVSWFKKQYPKQNKTFEIYAVEADRTFHDEYRRRNKGGVVLLPYAAWVRNETLAFEINDDDPGHKDVEERGRGMGRILRPSSSGKRRVSTSSSGKVDRIRGFDFAKWLEGAVSERDYVVVKMDVEGTEFDLIPRLLETGAMCLIDEMFLECHYNRWQKCCPGERSWKYEKTYGECLDLFTSLRKSGVYVHQWW